MNRFYVVMGRATIVVGGDHSPLVRETVMSDGLTPLRANLLHSCLPL